MRRLLVFTVHRTGEDAYTEAVSFIQFWFPQTYLRPVQTPPSPRIPQQPRSRSKPLAIH